MTNVMIAVSATDADGAIATASVVATQQTGGAQDGPFLIPDGFPNASTTGPVAGTVLVNTTGNLNSSADGQVFQNLNLVGSITVTHKNVTVQNCVIDGTGQLYAVGVPDNITTNQNLRVLHCKILATPTTHANSLMLDGIYDASEVGWCDISLMSNAVDCGQPAVSNCYIHDSYIHDFVWYSTPAPDGDHDDGLQTYGCSNFGGLTVTNNTIIGIQNAGNLTATTASGTTSCLNFYSGMFDLTISGNFFIGGAYTIYGPSQNGGGGHPVNVQVTNNRFSTQFYAKCGEYGPATGWDNTAPGFMWSGNVWHETGLPVTLDPWPN